MLLRTPRSIVGGLLTTVLLLGFGNLVSAQSNTAAVPERVITKIKDDLYSFRSGRHIGMFLVTPAVEVGSGCG